jgi:hypothetical protein
VDEWLASPYSAAEGGLVCIDCHGAPCRGVRRIDHLDQASSATALASLRDAARLTVIAVRDGGFVEAEVVVANVGVGHLLPTGSPGRSLVLEVAAHGPEGAPLPLRRGPRLAPRVGETPAAAGRIFVRDPHGTSFPSRGARLAPFATDVSRYRFAAPEGGFVEVAARLLLVPVEGKPLEIANTATFCRGSGLKH